ncbi:hypothetical protein [Halorubrum sp. DTA98]|uniref:hypothetical protein n=1 Tax=Halorubrum sp. DTA98 TaxID=3402163 RepID=UPI003AACEBA0
MFAIIEFVVRVVTDVGRFLDIFVNDLILGAGDPLSVLAIVFGMTFIGLASVVFGYSVIGALFAEIGVKLPSFGGRGRAE